MHRQQYRVRILRGFARATGLRLVAGFFGESLELPLAVGIAEHHFVPGAGEEGAELAAHQA